MEIDNIQIDLTAIYVTLGFLTGILIAPIDAALIKREYKLGFWYHGIKFTLLYALCAVFVNLLFPNDEFWILRLIAGGLMYSVSFDLFLNVLRGKDIFYIGKTAFLDKMARKYLKTGLNYVFWRFLLIFLIGAGITVYNIINN